MLFIKILSVIVDFVLMLGGALFNFNSGFPMPLWEGAFVLALIILVLRRSSHRHRFFVKAFYGVFVFFTLDEMAVMGAGIYGWNTFLLLLPAVSYGVILNVRHHRFLQWDRLQCLIVPFFATFVLSSFGDFPQSAKACKRISGQKGVRLLYAASAEYPQSKTRYLLEIPESSKILVSYRRGIFSSTKAALVAIDTQSGHKHTWLYSPYYEVIGLGMNDYDGDIYAVIVRVGFGTRCEGEKACAFLLRFSPSGRMREKIFLPGMKEGSYSASLFLLGSKLLVMGGNKLYSYDIRNHGLKLIRARKKARFHAVSRVHDGHNVYGVFSHTPFIMILPSIIKFDTRAMRVIKSRSDSVFGYYDIKKMAERDRFVVSNLWIGGGIVFDSELNVVSHVNIPKGVRSFDMDKSGRYVFAPNFFTGELRILDLKTNMLLSKKYFVGKGARTVGVTENGNILMATSCGVAEIATKEVLPRMR